MNMNVESKPPTRRYSPEQKERAVRIEIGTDNCFGLKIPLALVASSTCSSREVNRFSCYQVTTPSEVATVRR